MREKEMEEMLDEKELTEDEFIEQTEDDIINKLISPTDVPERIYEIERLGIQVTLKGLTDKEISMIRKKCTETVKGKRGRPATKELNGEEFDASLIEKATVKPNWGDKRLLKSLNLSSGAEVIKRQLLAGEMSSLSDKVMELSGYDDELEEVGIKNY